MWMNGNISTELIEDQDLVNLTNRTAESSRNDTELEGDDGSNSRGGTFLFLFFILMLLCVIATIFNMIILLPACRIRRMSTTLKIKLSLAWSDIHTMIMCAVCLVINSFLPNYFDKHVNNCGQLLIEAMRMGALMSTFFHLFALAGKYFMGTQCPLFDRQAKYCCSINGVLLILWIAPPIIFVLCFYFFIDEGEGFTTHDCNNNTFKLAFFRDWRDPSFDGEVHHHQSSPWTDDDGLLHKKDLSNLGRMFLVRRNFRNPFSAVVFICIILFVTVHTYIFISVKRRNDGQFKGRHSQLSQRHGKGSQQSKRDQRERRKKASRNAKTTMLIIGSLLIGWVPPLTHYALVCEDCFIGRGEGKGQITLTQNMFIAFFCNALLLLKTALNSWIYIVHMPEIKKALKRMKIEFLIRCYGSSEESDNLRYELSRLGMSSFTSRRTITSTVSVQDEPLINGQLSIRRADSTRNGRGDTML